MSMNIKTEPRLYSDGSIASLTGSSQTLFAANKNRRILVIHNINATNPVAICFLGNAASLTGAGSIKIAAGGSFILDSHCPTSVITVIGTAADKVTAYEA